MTEPEPTPTKAPTPLKSRLEALAYIVGILPWHKIGMVICFLGLLVTAGLGWSIAQHSQRSEAPATFGGGLGLVASAIALASGLSVLRRP